MKSLKINQFCVEKFLIHENKKILQLVKFNTQYFFGGHAQNRTGIEGFAILCVTIPPRGQFCNKIDSINSLYYTKLLYV